MRLHYKTCGLSNVWLLNGYKTHETKYGSGYSYEDIDGLYQAITVAVCTTNWKITPEVIRFLRKRIGFSQAEFGKEFGCTGQAVAKWEKGTSSIPDAVSRLARIICLARFAPNMMLHEVIMQRQSVTVGPLEFEYVYSTWNVAGTKKPPHDEEVYFESYENGNQPCVAFVEDLMVRLSPKYGNTLFNHEGTSNKLPEHYEEILGSD